MADISELVQRIKAAAEKASVGDWVQESGDGWDAICSTNGGFIIAHFEGPDAAVNRNFVQSANPANILTLTVVLEKAQARIAELESRTVKLPEPHAHLIWIQAGHAPDGFWDYVTVSHSEKDRSCDGSERYPVYARWEIEEVLKAAGIKLESE